ncbi:diacylglycerol kinase family protein [uncultured Pseudokineococcus sp.]|uniref:diacylglycerol/lipid kinase family protein n=1 Tax=uncultured Pseudokineococcus sp. TaxID=1642928 RepID=UPI002608AB4E|nr:diacylglycerol kinase family protein [uncultured Pseudokineococcus sp.]
MISGVSPVAVGTGRLPLDSAQLGLVGLALLVVVALLTLVARPKGRQPIPSARRDAALGRREADEDYRHVPGELDSRGPRAVVVVQPVKFPPGSAARRAVEQVVSEHGWPAPRWLETSEDDPGQGQARRAAQLDPEVVLVLGGDGTVRAVAEGLAGTGVPMGLVPGGTGNLFARQLKFDLNDPAAATRAALTGRDKRVDVGRVSLDGGEEQVFLVMAGVGFDAQMMAGAPAAIKDRVGPLAYVVSGLRRLKGESLRVSLSVDGEPPVTNRVRMAVVGNCGTLIGGIVLIPDAEVDDGHLDVLTLSPRGLVDWLRVGVRLVTRHRAKDEQISERQVKEVVMRCEQPEAAQMDGDVVGEFTELRMRVDPGALVIRTPEGRVPRRAERLADALRRG